MINFIMILIVVLVLLVLSGLRVVNQYERGVVLTLGRFTGLREPGLRVVIPIFQTMIKVDICTTPIDVPKARGYHKR